MALKPRINIYDVDYTTISGATDDVLDIAFIPGFTNKYINATISTSAAPSSYWTKAQVEAQGIKPVWYDTNSKVKYNLELGAAATWRVPAFTAGVKPSYSLTLTNVPEGMSDTFNFNAWPSQNSGITEIPLMTLPSAVNISDIVENGGYIPLCVMSSSVCYLRTTTTITIPNNSDYNSQVSLTFDATQHVYSASVIYDPSLDDIKYCEELGLKAYTIDTNSNTVTMYSCIATAGGYHYVEAKDDDYDYFTPGEIYKFNSLAEFKSAIGTEPYAIWEYRVDDSEPEFSELSLYDFAATRAETPSAVDVAKYIQEHLNTEDAIRIAWVDTNWIYAAELLSQGLPIYYCMVPANGGRPISDITNITDIQTVIDGAATAFTNSFDRMYAELADKGEYDVKYITTGTFGIGLDENDTFAVNEGRPIKDQAQFIYPFYAETSSSIRRSYVGYLADIANYRKDAVVLADGLRSYDDSGLNPANESSVYNKFKQIVESRDLVNLNSGDIYTADEQAKMGRRLSNTFPWYKATVHTTPAYWNNYRTDKSNYIMPGSFAYLISLATSIQKYESASWEAIAGVTRALVPDFIRLDINERLSNAVADAYNKRNDVGINAITNIRPYGYCIWGNRTLVDNAYFAKQGDGTDGLIASSFVDIMSMVCNVNKIAYRTCKRLMFEKDNDVLWTRFRQGCEPYLDQLLTAGALRTYTVEKLEPTMRGQLVAKITLYCTYSVENFDIEIALRDTEAETNV